MKKTFKRTDGTEETVEGTAEELAEYERRLRGELAEQKRPPPVLKGAELDGEPVTEREVEYLRSFRKLIRDPNTFKVPDEFFRPFLPAQPLYPYPTVPSTPWINPQLCPYCGQYDCHQAHITCTTLTCSSILTGDGLAKMIEERPDWDWTGLAVGGGVRIPLS